MLGRHKGPDQQKGDDPNDIEQPTDKQRDRKQDTPISFVVQITPHQKGVNCHEAGHQCQPLDPGTGGGDDDGKILHDDQKLRRARKNLDPKQVNAQINQKKGQFVQRRRFPQGLHRQRDIGKEERPQQNTRQQPTICHCPVTPVAPAQAPAHQSENHESTTNRNDQKNKDRIFFHPAR